jgi:hypothetical protein
MPQYQWLTENIVLSSKNRANEGVTSRRFCGHEKGASEGAFASTLPADAVTVL